MSLLTVVGVVSLAVMAISCTPLDMAKAATQAVVPSDPSEPPVSPVTVTVDVGGITVTTGGAEQTASASPGVGDNPGVFAGGVAVDTPVCEVECFNLDDKSGILMPIGCPY